MGTVTASYSDYKKIRGDWEYSHKRESQVTNSQTGAAGARVTTVVKSVEVNSGLVDSLFDASALK